MAEPGNAICAHGINVLVKKRALKRASTLLKHARFLSNLSVTPIFPEPVEEQEGLEGEIGEGDKKEDEDSD